MPLQIRRGTDAERVAMTQKLAPGELLWVTDDKKLYIGDGATLSNTLAPVTGFTAEDAQEAAASLFTTATHTGIIFDYNDVANTLTATVDLSNYSGTLTASSFSGSLVSDNSTLLVDAIDGTFNLDGTVRNVVPVADALYDLGSSSAKFRNLYLTSSGLTLGTATITSTGSAVNLPAGSTVGGNLIDISAAGIVNADLKGSVFGEDSSMIVDATSSSLRTAGLLLSGNTITADTNVINLGNIANKTEVQLYQDATGAFLRMYSETDSGTGDSPWINIYGGRGTLNTPAISAADDNLSGMLFFGHDGSNYSRAVSIVGKVAGGGTIAAGKVPGEFLVLVQSDTVSVSQQLRFDYHGILSAPELQSTGYASAAARDLARPIPNGGEIAYLQDTGKFTGYNGVTATWNDLN